MDMSEDMQQRLHSLHLSQQLRVALVLSLPLDAVQDAMRRPVRDHDVRIVRDLGPVSLPISRGRQAESPSCLR